MAWPPAGATSPHRRRVWLADDTQELDAIRDRIIEDLGSDYDEYSNVSSIGWAA